MKDYNDQLKVLLDETTVIKIEDNRSHNVLFEKVEDDPEMSQFHLYNRDPFDFTSLEQHWNSKWESFGNKWTHERQLFRYLWHEVGSFIQSYLLYRENFFASLNLSFEQDKESMAKRNRFDLRADLAIRSMYEYGKQAIDLLMSLSELNVDIKQIVDANDTFLSQFKKTRNNFLMHYHNPTKYKDLVFDPGFFSLMGTGSLFEVRIHIPNQEEHRFTAEINHYADYFKLEKIFRELIESF